MKNYCSRITTFFKRIDPVYDNFFSALYVTIPALLTGFYAIYSLRPFSTVYVLIASFIFIGLLPLSNYKDKRTYLTVYLLLISTLDFIINIFISHPTVIIVCIFIIILPVLAVDKFRGICLPALARVAITLNEPGGWDNALNGIIEIIVMGLIVLFCILIFEYLFSKIRMRAHLLYFMELLADAFYIMTSTDDKKVLNKHLFVIPLNYRSDFSVEHIFSSSQNILMHRLFIQLTKSNRFIINEDYYFQKNRNYQNTTYLPYIQCRKIYRELAFIAFYLKNEAEIQLLLPSTKDLISNINSGFDIIYKAIETQKNITSTLDNTLVTQWLAEAENLKNSQTMTINKEILEFIYGIKCLIIDIRKFEELSK